MGEWGEERFDIDGDHGTIDTSVVRSYTSFVVGVETCEGRD